MERLRIKNFLLIEDADFEVGRFTVFIGSQASGKSVVAKVLYFFREFFYDACFTLAVTNTTKEVLEKNARITFIKIFPEYTWGNQEFKLTYHLDDFQITLSKSQQDDDKQSIKLSFSKSVTEFHNEIRKRKGDDGKVEDAVNYLLLHHHRLREGSLFIPTGRSFFAILQNNIFTLLARDIEIDYLVKRFGSVYETCKKRFGYFKQPDAVNFLIETILVGRYQYKSELDWIEKDGKTINLLHASSGQQEALPMLASLLNYPANYSCIEEPETHLFPVSQKHVISLLAWLYNQYKREFVITTHSPYILTAINNAILAHDVMREKGEDAVKEFFDPEFAIKYEDVRAYTIENGRLSSILDDKARLIGAEIIDSVSSEFETVFSDLLELQNS